MSILNQVLGMAVNQMMGGQRQAASPMVGLITAMLTNQQSGGLTGLLGQLAAGGLSQQVETWIGTGGNAPVTPQQLQQALGQNRVQEMSQQSGLPTDQLLGGLAQYLPNLVDGLTPNGHVPAPSVVQEMLAMFTNQTRR